jgi:hypothetical protein
MDLQHELAVERRAALGLVQLPVERHHRELDQVGRRPLDHCVHGLPEISKKEYQTTFGCVNVV